MFSFLPWVSENVPEWKSHDMLYTNTWVGWVCGAFCWSRWTQNICLVWTVLMCVEILVRAFYLLSYKFNTKLETWLGHGIFIIARLLKVIVHGWEEMKWQSHVPYCVRNTDLTLPATAWSMYRSLLFLLFSTSLLTSTFPVSQIYLYTKLPQLSQLASTFCPGLCGELPDLHLPTCLSSSDSFFNWGPAHDKPRHWALSPCRFWTPSPRYQRYLLHPLTSLIT